MRGQISLESVFIISLILIVFIMLTISIVVRQNESGDIRNVIGSIKTCDRLANEVESLFILGDNSEGSIYLDHNVSVNNRNVSIGNVYCYLCCNISYSSLYSFDLEKGFINLKNSDGEIIVS